MRPEAFIKRIEDQKFSFLTGFLGLFSIILCRNILESVFEGTQVLGFSPITSRSFYMTFIHFPLFYISLFFCILLIFIIFTRENWIKIAKVLLIGMTVITLTPLIDIIVSKGCGYKLTYLRSFEQFSEIHKIFNFSRDLINASWGQRVEIILVLVGGLGYVLIKTRNILKAILASAVVYLIIFLHGVIPNTIARIPSYLGSNLLHYRTILTNGILPIDSQNYAVIFSISIIICGIFVLWKEKKEFVKKVFNLKSSLLITVFLCLGILYGILLISQYYPFIFYNPFSYLIFILAVFTLFSVCAATFYNYTSLEFQILIISSLFFAVVLGPVFLLLITVFFIFKRYPKIKWLAVIPCFLAGFSLVFQGDTFKTIVPVNQQAIEMKGRKLAGWCYFLNADYNQSLDQYLRVYAIKEEDEILKRIGQCYLKLGKSDDGIKMLKSIAIPDYEVVLSLGKAYEQKGKNTEAIQIYEGAIERNIEPAEFYLKIAHIEARKGSKEGMILATEKGLLYGSSPYKIYQIKGDFYLGKGNETKAFEMFNRALCYNSRSVSALAGRGIIYYKEGDFEHAEVEFLKVLKIEPNNDAIYNNLGALYIVTDKYEMAEQFFKKSLKKNPNQTEAYYNLGLIYEKTGRIERALEMYNKVLQVNPSYVPARKKIEKLGL